MVGNRLNAKRPQLLLRADATVTIGAGHVMRLANLAEVWAADGRQKVQLVGNTAIPFVRDRLASIGVEVLAELPTAAFTGVLVVDTYDTSLRERYAERPGARLRVLVDDLGGRIPAGYQVVWNPNPYGSPSLYPGFAGEVLTGPSVVPVRRGLPRWSGFDPGTVGLTLGGGIVPELLIRAVLELAAAMPRHRFRGVGDWIPNGWERVCAHRPWDALARCSLLISAGGSTVWEAAAVGIPVVVVKTAANQERVCQWVRSHGASVVDASATDDPEPIAVAIRAAAAEPCRLPELTPGSERVVAALTSLAKGDVQTAVRRC